MEKNKVVAVIGAGVAGLISTKICLENNLNVVCFEMTSDIGGLWNYNTSLIENKGSVMKSTVINTSKEHMAFSDFPAPKEFPNYMHNRKLLEYFRLYADKFKLISHIRFNTKITKITKADDYEESGKWLVSSTTNNETKTELFDAVMICNGHHAKPNISIINGLNDENAKFKGEVIHSWQYREPYKYIDKRVLVIGVGNSGGDIAVELSRIGSQVYLSTRSGMWCSPRGFPGGLPGDYTFVRRKDYIVSSLFPSYYHEQEIKKLNERFDHELYSIKPNKTGAHHIFVNDDLPNRIASGSVIIKPNFKEFTEHSCIFEDDTVAYNLDLIVLCTGYTINFPLFDTTIISVKDNWVDLYKYMFPPQLKHGTLAVMGCIQPLGAINPVVELQARWVVRVIKGETKLPSKTEMDADIASKDENVRKKFYESSRHTIEVDYISFCDEIANLAGCKPELTKYFFTDFKLWKELIFGAATPYQYRLNGPGSNYKQAREHILTQHERVVAPFKTRKVINLTKNSRFNTNLLLSLFIILIAFYLKFFIFT